MKVHHTDCHSADTFFLELQHLVGEPLSFLADAVCLRHAHIVEEEFGCVRAAHAQLVDATRVVDA